MSQVTKPMALDETLQDVVTAIQGITQGGIIASTGTVGSSTQPVYIDGGVPTAVNYNINIVSQADSTIETLVTQIKTKAVTLSPGAYSFFGSWNSHSNGYQASVVKGDESATFWKVSGTVYEYVQGRVWTFIDIYNTTTQAWSGVKIRQISGITTGTPTNPGTNLSLGSYWVNKSGNMVNVKITLSITGAITADRQTELITLPWKPVNDYTQLDRMTGSAADNDTHYLGKCYVMTTGRVRLGFGPFEALTSGNYMWITGNYMTND